MIIALRQIENPVDTSSDSLPLGRQAVRPQSAGPLEGQIAAAALPVLGDIAGDVGQLHPYSERRRVGQKTAIAEP